jgi:hypothetical protein
MFVRFYINLVKVQTVWLLKLRELHSFVDGGSKYLIETSFSAYVKLSLND